LPVLREEGKFLIFHRPQIVAPPNFDKMAVTYVMKAGEAATHSPVDPALSAPNRSSRWRRLMSLRYARAEAAEMGERHYTDYRDRTLFDRQYYLVRGERRDGRTRADYGENQGRT